VVPAGSSSPQSERALGINCRGSSGCVNHGNSHDPHDLACYIDTLDDATWFNDGQYIGASYFESLRNDISNRTFPS